MVKSKFQLQMTVFNFLLLSLDRETVDSFPVPTNRRDSDATLQAVMDHVLITREDFKLTRKERRYLESLDLFDRPGYPDPALVEGRDDYEFLIDCILSSAAPTFTAS